MLWKPLGIAMIFPTISVAILITWQTRKIAAELFHNLAIVFWICANAMWMLLEFTGYDDLYRKYTVIPFGIGLFFIGSYYLVILPKEKRREKLLSIRETEPEESALPLEVSVANR